MPNQNERDARTKATRFMTVLTHLTAKQIEQAIVSLNEDGSFAAVATDSNGNVVELCIAGPRTELLVNGRPLRQVRGARTIK